MQNFQQNGVLQSNNKNIALYTRDISPNYYCRIKKPDTDEWVQRSTKKTNPQEALQVAEELYAEMLFLHKRGYSSTPTKFSKVCDLYIAELDKEVDLYERTEGEQGRNPKDGKSYRNLVNKYMRPYFKDKPIDTISNVDVLSFYEWRRTYWTEGPGGDIEYEYYIRDGRKTRKPVQHKEATDTTVNRTAQILGKVFQTAVRHKLLDEHKVPKIGMETRSKRKAAMGKFQPKPALTTKQYQDLMGFLPRWCLETSRDNHLKAYIDRRLLLWDLIELLANTGMRPGTETDHILWKHITFYEDRCGMPKDVSNIKTLTGQLKVSIQLPRGKSGARPTTGNVDAGNALLRIKKRYSDYQQGLTTQKGYYEKLLGGYNEFEPDGWIKPIEIDPEMPVSALPNGELVTEDSWRVTFGRMMKDFGLTHDTLGRRFTPYTLRHSYITWQLQAGNMSIHDIAAQCGNSVPVIEKHYAKVDVKSTAHRQVRIQDI